MEQSIVRIILGSMLVFCSGTDIKKRLVSSTVLVIFAGIGVILNVLFHRGSLQSMIGGIGLGLIVICISQLTKGGIGLGDGGVLCVMGLYVGFYENLEIFMLALFMAAVWGVILIIFKKAGRKTELPFIPFLTIAYVIVTLLC